MMESDRTHQEISRLCDDAGFPAVLAAVQGYCESRANWQRSEGEPFEHWLDAVEAIAKPTE